VFADTALIVSAAGASRPRPEPDDQRDALVAARCDEAFVASAKLASRPELDKALMIARWRPARHHQA